MSVLLIILILIALTAVGFGFVYNAERKRGEDWLRQEGYLPRTPEQIRREAMEENLRKLMKGGDPTLPHW